MPRKNNLFYKTENGARVSDCLTSHPSNEHPNFFA